MKYFTYDELKIIKSDVIERHLQLTKYKGEEKDDSAVEIEGMEASGLSFWQTFWCWALDSTFQSLNHK